MPPRKKENDTFIRLANKRVNATINSIAMITRLAESAKHIAGIDTENGQITYHLPIALWDSFDITRYSHAPKYDGHTSADVVARLAKQAAKSTKRELSEAAKITLADEIEVAIKGVASCKKDGWLVDPALAGVKAAIAVMRRFNISEIGSRP